MNHNIDTKAIQELAAMSPEAKAYLEREFPEVFTKYYYVHKKSVSNGIIWRRNITEQIDIFFIPDYKPNV